MVRQLALGVGAGTVLGAGWLAAGGGAGGEVSAAVVPAPAQFGFAVAAVGVAGTYFAEHLRPGSGAGLTLRVTSTVARPERLEVAPIVGATNTNTGDGYTWSGPCSTTSPRSSPTSACWISGLPASVVLQPRESIVLHARLDVPTTAAAGQYLLGVGVRSRPSAPSAVVGRGDASAVLRVVQEVNVGVAVTIGTAAQLRPDLVVTGVAERPGSGAVVASVRLADTGDTFVHSAGTLAVSTSTGPVTVRLAPGTILPGDHGAVDIGLGRLAAGSYPVAVALRYGGESGPLDRRAAWRGELVVGRSTNSFGVRAPAPSVLRTAVGRVPVWLWGLVGVLVGSAGLLLATRVAAWRQPGRHGKTNRRRRPVHRVAGRSAALRQVSVAGSGPATDRRAPPHPARTAPATWITDVADDVPAGAGRQGVGAHAPGRRDAPGAVPEVPVG